jgi:hypothetical protein
MIFFESKFFHAFVFRRKDLTGFAFMKTGDFFEKNCMFYPN